jgi:hypothetical protein
MFHVLFDQVMWTSGEDITLALNDLMFHVLFDQVMWTSG